MKRISTIMLIVLGLLILAAGPSINWLTYRQALDNHQHKPIMLYFWKPHCPQCDVLHKSFGDPKIVRFVNDNFVAASINGDANPRLRDEYAVMTAPMIYFLRSDGAVCDCIVGPLSPDSLLEILKAVATECGNQGGVT